MNVIKQERRQIQVAAAGTPPGRRLAAPRGQTLIELMITMVVMAVLVSLATPQFQKALEQSRADAAGANLRAIWAAQRLYWLENRAYAPDLATLITANLLDPALDPTSSPPNAPYSYGMTTDGSWFTASANRQGTTSWSGALAINAGLPAHVDGAIEGEIVGSLNTPLGPKNVQIVPGFQ